MGGAEQEAPQAAPHDSMRGQECEILLFSKSSKMKPNRLLGFINMEAIQDLSKRSFS